MAADFNQACENKLWLKSIVMSKCKPAMGDITLLDSHVTATKYISEALE